MKRSSRLGDGRKPRTSCPQEGMLITHFTRNWTRSRAKNKTKKNVEREGENRERQERLDR